MHRFSPLLLTLFFTACNQEPSSTGIGLLPQDDFVNVQSYDTRSDTAVVLTSTYKQRVTGEGSPFLSVGKADGYEGHALLRWLLPSDIGEGGEIRSATIKLYVAPYHIGDKNLPLSMEIREVTSFWSSFTFSSDSLSKLTHRSLPGGAFQAVVRDSVELAIDSSVVRTWLRRSAEFKSSEIYGLLLKPSGDGLLQALESSESGRPPVFTIRMNWNGVDTLIQGSALEDTYVATGPNFTTESFLAHGALAYRGKVIIDISAIPPGSTINHASFEITVDRANSVTRYRGIDSLVALEMISGDTTSSVSTLSRKGTNDVFVFESFSLTRLVQKWVNTPSLNRGLAVMKVGEASDFDLLRFYDGAAQIEKRPRLVVTFTRQP